MTTAKETAKNGVPFFMPNQQLEGVTELTWTTYKVDDDGRRIPGTDTYHATETEALVVAYLNGLMRISTQLVLHVKGFGGKPSNFRVRIGDDQVVELTDATAQVAAYRARVLGTMSPVDRAVLGLDEKAAAL